MGIHSRVRVSALFILRPKHFLFLLPLTQLGLGLGNPFSVQIRKEVFGSFLFFFPELSARVRVRVLEILFPFLYFFSDPNTDLFFLAVSVRHFSHVVAVVTGVLVTSATPGPFSVSFTRLGLGLHRGNLVPVPLLESMITSLCDP